MVRSETERIRQAAKHGLKRAIKLQQPEVVAEIVATLCTGAVDADRQQQILEYLDTHAVVLNRDHIGSLVETLKAVEDDDATDFILVFLERLAESGEDFNIEGICVEQHISVLLHYFPNETAVHIVEILVRHSKDCAHVVFSLNGRASFLSFLEPQTVNLPCVIRFLAGFFLYDDFLSFNSQQLRPLLNLAVDGTDNEVTCAALEALIEASSWAALSSEFAASDLFAKLF